MKTLNEKYYPMYLYAKEFCEGAERAGARPVIIALERGEGEAEHYATVLYNEGHERENFRYAERIVKFMLWAYGGYKFYIWGADEALVEELRECYSDKGARKFDVDFMEQVYLTRTEFARVENAEDLPAAGIRAERSSPVASGKRIGFDAGGSDRKVTACIDGKVVYEKETIWYPKLQSDPEYHRMGIEDSIDNALAALGGEVEAIGVSTAGIVVDGEIRVASLFRKVPQEIYREKVFPIYKNLAKKYGCPVKVANDGDVAALAGAFGLGKGKVLGIAMGTSLAGGFVDGDMRIRGYLNELAFAPVDADPEAQADEWSGDIGVGGNYHSQDAVIRLAPEAGIELTPDASPAEKLKEVQKLAEAGDERAIAIFTRLGDYAAYTLMWFRNFYDFDTAIVLGRVASGKGGDVLIARARTLLAELGSDIAVELPDEMSRRLGQSYTATQL